MDHWGILWSEAPETGKYRYLIVNARSTNVTAVSKHSSSEGFSPAESNSKDVNIQNKITFEIIRGFAFRRLPYNRSNSKEFSLTEESHCQVIRASVIILCEYRKSWFRKEWKLTRHGLTKKTLEICTEFNLTKINLSFTPGKMFWMINKE